MTNESKQYLSWSIIAGFLAWVVLSAIVHDGRMAERRAVLQACGSDLECELVEDVINRMEGK